MEKCLFCGIANGQIPAKKVFEDDKVAAVLDINPAAQGHILVLPKKHVEVLLQMDDDLSAHVGMICKQLSQVLLQAFQCEGTSIFVANGPVAGQRAPHGMVHVIPRAKGDGVALELSVVRLDEKSLNDVHKKLVQSVAASFGAEPVSNNSKANSQKEEKKKDETKKVVENKDKKLNLDDIADFLAGAK